MTSKIILPCLPRFLKNTTEGDRNTNLFHALKKIKHFYPEITQTHLHQICNELNQNLEDPLNETEVTAITKSVNSRLYPSNCYSFKNYCQSCRIGKGKPLFKNTKKHYWKFIDEKNHIKSLLPKKVYLWDIEDLSQHDDYTKEIIHDFRVSKGINPLIDEILKRNNVPIGDEALNEFRRYQDE